LTERVAHTRRYETSLDRAGLALGVGAVLGGVFAALLAGMGEGAGAGTVATGFLVGIVVTAIIATAIGGPLWLVLHVVGRRGPLSAVLAGAISGFLLFLGGQTYGFGLFPEALLDTRTWLYRWASAAAVSLILAAISALIGWTMWRVAYRRMA
jgi:hypothetical protein